MYENLRVPNPLGAKYVTLCASPNENFELSHYKSHVS